MKVRTLGIVIIALPIVIQVAVVGGLCALLQKRHHSTVQQWRWVRVSALSQEVTLKSMQNLLLEVAVMQGSPITLEFKTNSDVLSGLKSSVASIRELVGIEPNQMTNLNDLHAAMLQTAALYESFRAGQKIEKSDAVFFFTCMNVAKASISIARTAVENVQHEFDDEFNILATALLIFGFITSVVSSVMLAVFAANSVWRPLRRVDVNAGLIAARKDLMPMPKPGNEVDELAVTLDRVDALISRGWAHERRVMNAVTDLICSVDRDGNIIRANAATHRVLRISNDADERHSLFSYVSNLHADKFSTQLDEVVDSASSSQFELDLVLPNHTLRPYKCSLVWSKVDGTVVTVLSDLREQRRIETLKRNFISLLTNQMIGPIISCAKDIDRLSNTGDERVTPEVRAKLRQAASNLQTMSGLVNEVIALAQNRAPQSMSDSKASLLDALSVVQELLQEQITQKSVTLVFPVEDNLLCVSADNLTRVLLNLIGNALKFSPSCGRIVVESVLKFPTSVRVCVHDDGPGIDLEKASQLFLPFEKGAQDDQRGGSGLGLHIVQQIIDNCAGSCGAVKSPRLNGSCFWFELLLE